MIKGYNTPIVYTDVKTVSNELKDMLLNVAFDREILEQIQEFLIAENADVKGENETLISEIQKILDSDCEAIDYYSSF